MIENYDVMPVESPQQDRRQDYCPRALLVYSLLFGLFATAAVLLPASEDKRVLIFSAIAGALTATYVVFILSAMPDDLKSLEWLVLPGAAIDVICHLLVIRYTAVGGARPEVITADNTGGAVILALLGVANLGMLGVAVGSGLLLAKGLRSLSYLLVAAIASALADTISVAAGPTKHIMALDVAAYISLQWGVIGLGGVTQIVGMGDFIFLTLFFTGARKFGWNDTKTLLAMSAALMAGFLAMLVPETLPALPALPFMTVALLAAHATDIRRGLPATRPAND